MRLEGYCLKCGEPIYSPAIWYGVMPPALTYNCSCIPRTVRAMVIEKELVQYKRR